MSTFKVIKPGGIPLDELPGFLAKLDKNGTFADMLEDSISRLRKSRAAEVYEKPNEKLRKAKKSK